MEITNQTIGIITGASSGIGHALALRLASSGARLGIVARREERLQDLASEIESRGGSALILPCDVTKREELERAVETTIERFGGLDLLVNNAGRGHFAYIEETPEAQIESIFRVNVFSLWYGTAPAVRWMRRHGRGHIINIASMAGKIGFPANAAYVAAKHATVGFTRALRAELAGTGVEATVVCPAGVATEWASVTEGGPMLEIFDYERRRGEKIMREHGGEAPPAIPLLGADEVAEAIVDVIRNPRPELYTHPGTRELADRYQLDQEGVERLYEPFHLANIEGWEGMRASR